MLKESENQTLTRVGPGTAAGAWLRKYWLPIAISDKWNGVKTLWKCDESFSFKGKAGTVAGLGEQLVTFGGNPTAVRILWRISFFSAMAVTVWAFSGFAVRTGIRHWSTA